MRVRATWTDRRALVGAARRWRRRECGRIDPIARCLCFALPSAYVRRALGIARAALCNPKCASAGRGELEVRLNDSPAYCDNRDSGSLEGVDLDARARALIDFSDTLAFGAQNSYVTSRAQGSDMRRPRTIGNPIASRWVSLGMIGREYSAPQVHSVSLHVTPILIIAPWLDASSFPGPLKFLRHGNHTIRSRYSREEPVQVRARDLGAGVRAPLIFGALQNARTFLSPAVRFRQLRAISGMYAPCTRRVYRNNNGMQYSGYEVARGWIDIFDWRAGVF